MDSRKVKFSLIQAFFWCASASFASYVGAYMQSRGMSSTMLGLMFTVNTLCAFFGQFFWGMLCDRLRTHKRVFLIAMLCMCAVQFLIFFTENWTLVILLFGLFGSVQQPMISNMDTWILKTYRADPTLYGPIRSIGSLAFSIFTFFYGGILLRNGYQLMLVFSTGFLAAMALIVLMTPDIRDSFSGKRPDLSRETLHKLFADKEYLLVLLLLFGVGFASAPLLQMLPVLVNGVGGTVEHLGYAMSLGALLEAPLMLFSIRLGRFSPKKRLIAASFLYTASLLLAAFSASWQLTVLCSALYGVGYGLYLPALREYISRVAPRELSTTAQGVADATEKSLGRMMSGFLVGILFDAVSIPLTVGLCALSQAVFVVIFLAFSGKNARRNAG